MTRLVHNYGINNATYKINWSVDGVRYRCPIYATWKDVLRRTTGKKEIEALAAYSDCTISESFKYFMDFQEWTIERDWKGFQLDKDILIRGNRHYSPETCIYVPNTLNQILKQPRKSVTDLPLGVRYLNGYRETKDKFEVYSGSSSQYIYLGTYYNKEDAHRVWQTNKISQIEREIIKLEEMSFKDERIYPALQRLIDKLQYDVDNKLETIEL